MFIATLVLVALLDSSGVRDIQVGPGELLHTTTIGSGRPVVLIPGIFGGAFGFRRITAPLAERGYRCIVIEPLGFGWSSHPSRADYSFAAQADRIGQVLDSLGASEVLMIAQSTGAAMAYRLAYRRPDLVRGILSIGGGPAETAATPGLKHALRFGGFLTKLFVGPGTIRSRVRHDLIENSGDATWVTAEVVDEYTAGQAADVHGTIDGLRRMAKSVEPESLRERLHESRIPIRLLHGTFPHPSSIKPEEVELLRAELLDFEVDTVPGAGQYLGEERPESVVDALDRLAAGVLANYPNPLSPSNFPQQAGAHRPAVR